MNTKLRKNQFIMIFINPSSSLPKHLIILRIQWPEQIISFIVNRDSFQQNVLHRIALNCNVRYPWVEKKHRCVFHLQIRTVYGLDQTATICTESKCNVSSLLLLCYSRKKESTNQILRRKISVNLLIHFLLIMAIVVF